MVKRPFLTPLIPLLGILLVGQASAGTDTPIKPYRSIQIGPAVTMSTTDFNPQIAPSMQWTPQIAAENENTRPFTVGPANNLKAGSVSTTPVGSPGKYFPGISFTGWVPPDPEIAVGPDYVVSTVNTDIAFFRKSDGTKVFQQTMSSTGFFSGIGVTSSFTFDPKCFYDKISGRFFVLIAEQDAATTTSKILIAVSDDSNPLGTWYKYRIEAKANDGSGDHWLDYPGFGYNKDAILVTGNMFAFTSGNFFIQFIVIPKAPLLTGGSATARYILDGTMGTCQPARIPDSSVSNLFAFTALTSTSVRVLAVTNPATSPTLVKKEVSVPSWSPPSPVPVNGGRFLDGLDGRIYNCHYRNGHLVAAHTTKSADGRMQARWYDVLTNTWPASGSPSLKQSGNILLTGTNAHMPAINTNAAGDISVIYSRNNASTNPETVYSARKITDTLGQIGAPIVLQSSAGVYGGAGVNRWGDYFGCEIDPNDSLTFWGIGMVAASNGAWQTTIHKWTVSTGTSGTLVNPTAINLIQGNYLSGDLTNVTSSNNSYYSFQSYLIDASGNPVGPGTIPTAQVASVQTDYQLDMSSGTLNDLKVQIECNANNSGVAGQMYCYNWNTGLYELATSFSLTTADKVNSLTVPKASLSKYVTGAGNVRILIRGIVSIKTGRPTAIPSPFTFNIDQIGLSPSFGS